MILLDTHAWLWWVDDPGKLSPDAGDAIKTADVLGISPISCWEIAMLVAKNRLKLKDTTPAQWIDRVLGLTAVELMPISAEAALLAGSHTFLPDHPDPADRLVLATAATRDIPLITKDRHLRRASSQQNIIW